MRDTYLSLIALFTGSVILYLGIGLMNILVPVRMGIEGISTDVIGMVLSLYFVGMFSGALYSKRLVKRVGHVRAFAGSVAIEAICILAFTLDSNAWIWGGLRIVLGFSHACLLTALESWLSDSASEESRGKVLGLYSACVYAGLFFGQFLIGLGDPAEDKLFVLIGILLSLSAIPVLFSRSSGPVVETIAPMSFVSLYRISPLGVTACLVSGILYSALFNMLPVFAADFDISGFQLSLYLGCSIIGAFLLQFPVGYLSDRYDRRTVLALLLVISALSGLAVIPLTLHGHLIAMFIMTGITAGLIACFYPISISEAFDKLKKDELVSAMGSMLLAFGIGGAIGPYTASLFMEGFGSISLFYYLAVAQLGLAGFTLYRMGARKALPVEQQEAFVMQSAAFVTMGELDPRTRYSEPAYKLSTEAETAKLVAESDPAAAVKMARALVLRNPQLGMEVTAALASVPGIDVLRLYEVMKEAVPFQILDITHAIVKAQPEQAPVLVSQLAEWYPQQVVPVAIEIGRIFPEQRREMARIAAKSAPESASQVAEYYSGVIAEERQAVRPADRDDDHSEEDALQMASDLCEVYPEQALDIASTVVQSVPETAIPLTEEFLASGWSVDEQEQEQDSKVTINKSETVEEGEYTDALEWVNRISEAAPEQTLDIAAAVVEAVPEALLPVTGEILSDTSADAAHEYDDTQTVIDGPDDSDYPQPFDDKQKTLDWIQKMAEISPESSIDLAAKIVEIVPESASYVAAAIARIISEQESRETVESDDVDVAVELVNRVSEMAPEATEDVAVAVVENIPEAASEIVDAISVGDEAREGEWQQSVNGKPAADR